MDRYRFLISAVVVFVVLFGSAYALLQQPLFVDRIVDHFRDTFKKNISGFFVLETANGSVETVTVGGENVQLLADASAKPAIAYGVIAPDRSRGAAVRFSPNLLEIISFALPPSPELQVLANHEVIAGVFGARVTYPVWSPDSRILAYRFSPTIPETVIAELVGPRGGFDPLSGVSVSSETTLPEEYLPAIYVVGNNEPQQKYGTGVPIAFSPDGRFLLVEDESQLYLVALASETRTRVSEWPRVDSSETIPLQLRLIPGSSHILAWAPTERIDVYALDWEQGALSFLGELPNGESAQDVVVDASTGTRALVVVSDGENRRAVEYRLGKQVTPGRSFDLAIPADTRLLQWFSE